MVVFWDDEDGEADVFCPFSEWPIGGVGGPPSPRTLATAELS
jgi:hypothetical protein